jgi:hypothetical protein
MDAGMPMPALLSSRLMPSYAKITNTDVKKITYNIKCQKLF